MSQEFDKIQNEINSLNHLVHSLIPLASSHHHLNPMRNLKDVLCQFDLVCQEHKKQPELPVWELNETGYMHYQIQALMNTLAFQKVTRKKEYKQIRLIQERWHDELLNQHKIELARRKPVTFRTVSEIKLAIFQDQPLNEFEIVGIVKHLENKASRSKNTKEIEELARKVLFLGLKHETTLAVIHPQYRTVPQIDIGIHFEMKLAQKLKVKYNPK